MVLLGLVETVIYALNLYIYTFKLKAVDVGGSVVIHSFGAIFGLAATRFLGHPRDRSVENASSSYTSDIFSFIGTKKKKGGKRKDRKRESNVARLTALPGL